MDIGMPSLLELDTIEETVNLCSNLKLDFVELNMNLPGLQVENILKKVELMKSLAVKNQIYYTLHLDEKTDFCDFNELVSNAYQNTILRTIDLAKILNISIINMHLNCGVYFTLPNEKFYLYEKYFALYTSKIENLIQLCERQIGSSNITICVENTNGYLPFQQSALEIMLQSDKFALTLDIGHSCCAGYADEKFILANITKLKHFHFSDAIVASCKKSDHLILGQGDIDIEKYITIAKQCNARVVIETKTIEGLISSISWCEKNGILNKNK